MNDQLQGNGPNQSLTRLTGNGNGGSDQSTGWMLVSATLGTLPAGIPTISIEGFQNTEDLQR